MSRLAIRPLLLAGACLATLARSAPAQHAHQQAAGDRLGRVPFSTSCRADVAPAFDRAMALLHSFEFGDALRAFDGVLAADSTCAMAHWGIALARWSNPMAPALRAPAVLARGRAAAETAARLAGGASPRERAYVAAVMELYKDHERVDQRTRLANYERAMGALAARHPEDTEATIFHALAVVGNAPPTDKSYAALRRAGAMLESLWVKAPDHPGLAHYIIHAYDVPALAALADSAARRYAGIAPAAAHAQHMPSHTFTRLGRWRESIDANRRSADAALRGSSIAEALHASDYLVYAYLQLRRDADARAVLRTLPALAARFDPNAVTGAAPGWAGIFALAAMPARYALERDAWAEAAALAPAPSVVPFADAMTWFARAIGAARSGRPADARAAADTLEALRRRLAERGEGFWEEQVAIQRLGALAWAALAEGRRDEALARMREAATREDATEKSAVTPGPLAPARELLGDMLLAVGRPADALAEYRGTIAKEPGRWRALAGARRAAEAAGDRAAASGYARQLAAVRRG